MGLLEKSFPSTDRLLRSECPAQTQLRAERRQNRQSKHGERTEVHPGQLAVRIALGDPNAGETLLNLTLPIHPTLLYADFLPAPLALGIAARVPDAPGDVSAWISTLP